MAMLESPLPHRYLEKLASLPASGGCGCHTALLGTATLGVMSGIAPERVFADLRARAHGTRRVPDREIRDAVEKAARDWGGMPRWPTLPAWGRRAPGGRRHRSPTATRPQDEPKRFDAARFMEWLQERGGSIGEADFWEASPVRLDTPVGPEDAILLLEALYAPGDVLYLGERYGREVKTAAEWIANFRAGQPVPPHAIPNPVSGNPACTKDGRPSYRADACVKAFRFAVAEFDALGRDEQFRFWWAVDMPVCAIVDSGGKSLHAWIRVDGVGTVGEWTGKVEGELFGRWLVPLGCDAACRNEARLSRLPGHFRAEKGRWQRLLYLAPEGRPVHAGA